MKYYFPIILFVFLLSGCKDDDETVTPETSQNSPSLNVDFESAPFEKSTFTASTVEAFVNDKYIAIQATASDGKVVRLITNGKSVGSYPIDSLYESYLFYYPINDELGFSSSVLNNPSGSIVVSNVDTINKTISGAFSGIIRQYNNANNNSNLKTLTNGTFKNIPYATNSFISKPGYVRYESEGEMKTKEVEALRFPQANSLVEMISSTQGWSFDQEEFYFQIDSSLLNIGTYPLGCLTNVTRAQVIYTGDFFLSFARFKSKSGYLTISEIDRTEKVVRGSFNFTGEASINPSVTVDITKGSFRAYY